MKKIAYILTPVEFGGAERVSLNFLKNVDRNNFEVCPILLIRPWEKKNVFIQELVKENYPVHKIPVAIRTLNQGKDYFRVIRCFRILYSILNKGSFDLVHTNGYFADIIGIPISRLLGIPHIASCHGYIRNDRKLIIYTKLDLIVLRFSSKVIAVSREIQRDLIGSGLSESRVLEIQNAVELNTNKMLFQKNREEIRKTYDINNKEIVLGYVGRISREKGLRYLIEAASKLTRFGLPIRVMIIGDGSQRPEIECLAQERDLQSKVIFTGFQNDMQKWLPPMDLFILPSLTEGTPMALLEAMSCGIPVIASAVGGIPKIIDSGKNGILVSPAKPEEIVSAVWAISKNNELQKRLSNMAKETIRNKFNLNEWVKKIESIYLEMTNSGSSKVKN